MYKVVFSTKENFSCIHSSIASVIHEVSFGTKEEKSNLLTAVDEALTNVSAFAYPTQEKKPVKVSVIVNGNSIQVIIADKGCGIKNINKAMEPLFSTNREHSGLGFSIMKNCVDKVTVSSVLGAGTKVKLTKSFRR